MSPFAVKLGSEVLYHVNEYWCVTPAQITIGNSIGDKALSDVVVANLPSGMTVYYAVGLLGIAAAENNGTAINELNGTQVIRVKANAGTWDVDDLDAIDFKLGDFRIEAAGTPGLTSFFGITVTGGRDLSAAVVGNGTYNF